MRVAGFLTPGFKMFVIFEVRLFANTFNLPSYLTYDEIEDGRFF